MRLWYIWASQGTIPVARWWEMKLLLTFFFLVNLSVLPVTIVFIFILFPWFEFWKCNKATLVWICWECTLWVVHCSQLRFLGVFYYFSSTRTSLYSFTATSLEFFFKKENHIFFLFKRPMQKKDKGQVPWHASTHQCPWKINVKNLSETLATG